MGIDAHEPGLEFVLRDGRGVPLGHEGVLAGSGSDDPYGEGSHLAAALVESRHVRVAVHLRTG